MMREEAVVAATWRRCSGTRGLPCRNTNLVPYRFASGMILLQAVHKAQGTSLRGHVPCICFGFACLLGCDPKLLAAVLVLQRLAPPHKCSRVQGGHDSSVCLRAEAELSHV